MSSTGELFYLYVSACMLVLPVTPGVAANSDQATCTSDQCEAIMPGYRDATVYVRPKAQERYTYIEAETACISLNATVAMAVDERNKDYLEFATALKYGSNFDVWYFRGRILRSDSYGVPDTNATCYALQSKEAPDGRRYTIIGQVDCDEERNVICEIPRRGACGDWEPAWIFNGSCYKVQTASTPGGRALTNFGGHQRACEKMGANLASIHSDEEMRHVLNVFARHMEWDAEVGKYNNSGWQHYMAYLGIERRTDNNTLWVNTDNKTTPLDYGDPMGQVGHWPWCWNKPDGGNDSSKDVVRLGPFNSNDTSIPFEDPRRYGCWHDADGGYESMYAICKRPLASKATGSSRFFYYEPEVSTTLPPSLSTTITASTTQGAAVKSVHDESAAAQPRRHRRPDRHA